MDFVNVAPEAMRVLPATFRLLVLCVKVPCTVKVAFTSMAEPSAVKVAPAAISRSDVVTEPPG